MQQTCGAAQPKSAPRIAYTVRGVIFLCKAASTFHLRNPHHNSTMYYRRFAHSATPLHCRNALRFPRFYRSLLRSPEARSKHFQFAKLRIRSRSAVRAGTRTNFGTLKISPSAIHRYLGRLIPTKVPNCDDTTLSTHTHR